MGQTETVVLTMINVRGEEPDNLLKEPSKHQVLDPGLGAMDLECLGRKERQLGECKDQGLRVGL